MRRVIRWSFGIAKFISQDDEVIASQPGDDVTLEGRIVGTPRYMAPEQINGTGVYATSDLYSLALILYEMIAGQPAVRGDSTFALISKQVSGTAAVELDDPEIPSALRPVLNKASAKDPAERFSGAAVFASELRKLGSIGDGDDGAFYCDVC